MWGAAFLLLGLYLVPVLVSFCLPDPRGGGSVAPGAAGSDGRDNRCNDRHERFPEQRLHLREDGQLDGNVIVGANGAQHPLDDHKQETFDWRIKNYIVGTNEICM